MANSHGRAWASLAIVRVQPQLDFTKYNLEIHSLLKAIKVGRVHYSGKRNRLWLTFLKKGGIRRKGSGNT